MRRHALAFVSGLLPLLAYAGCGIGNGVGPAATFDAASELDATTEEIDDATTSPDVAAPSDGSIDVLVDAEADADAPVSHPSGCADGTREGLDLLTHPKVAACAGTWTGHVATATALCTFGWHVCNGSELALKAVGYLEARAFTGCFAFNAAHDNDNCYVDCRKAVELGVDDAADLDMGAIGGTCPYAFVLASSCLATGRIDFSENDGTGCNFATGLTGVTCCQD